MKGTQVRNAEIIQLERELEGAANVVNQFALYPDPDPQAKRTAWQAEDRAAAKLLVAQARAKGQET